MIGFGYTLVDRAYVGTVGCLLFQGRGAEKIWMENAGPEIESSNCAGGQLIRRSIMLTITLMDSRVLT